jgi:hypothetical protein
VIKRQKQRSASQRDSRPRRLCHTDVLMGECGCAGVHQGQGGRLQRNEGSRRAAACVMQGEVSQGVF